jgi:hypothetical protein
MHLRNSPGGPGLDYRDARKRYAPHIVACTRCDTLVMPSWSVLSDVASIVCTPVAGAWWQSKPGDALCAS